MPLSSSPPPIPSPEPPPPHDAVAATTSSPPAPTPSPLSRSNRPSRACTLRAAARLQQQQAEQRKPKAAKKKLQKPKQEKEKEEEEEEENDESFSSQQCGKTVTSLVEPPTAAQLPRWTLRSMWQLASVLNFLHVFRPVLNIQAEFSAEELETALIAPNDNLSDIHIPLLKAIPPVMRMALTHDTWISILSRKLRHWWHWVADGDVPIVPSQGAEIEVYKTLDPGERVVILKALCDIRVEQEDIRNYIDNSLKHGIHLSTFRKERIGGDSHGISYWYEDDPEIGYRLYREIRKTEVKKVRAKGSHVLPSTIYQWETVATNFDEFQNVGEKLFSSINRTEVAVGKKLKGDMLLEIEKDQKKKEKLLKKQHRQALLLDNYVLVDELGPGRSLRDRKPVTYTFDDYDRSISEAINITKTHQPSSDPLQKQDVMKHEVSSNGKWSGAPDSLEPVRFGPLSPKSPDFEDQEDDVEENDTSELMDRSNRRRKRPQRYSGNDFVERYSDNDADYVDSDDEIVGEAVYDDDYVKKQKKRRKFSSGSEGDEEYHWDEENPEEEEEEEEEDSASASEESDEPKNFKKLHGRPKELRGRTRREAKLRYVGERQSGLRRSKRATRNRIDYRQLEYSDSDAEPMKPEKSEGSDSHSDANENGDYSMVSQDSDVNDGHHEMEVDQDQVIESYPDAAAGKEDNQPPEKSSNPEENEVGVVHERRFLDLNELAPGSGFDDGPNTIMKDDADDL